jgi:NADH-quinone oxidoreductase subunit H
MSSLAADPLFAGGVDLTVVLIVIGKTIAIFALLLLSVLLYIWFLRKVIARMQNRIGPDRAGPFGLLQTLADGIKLFFKEQSMPTTADRKIFFLAPYFSVLAAFLAFAIVPIGGLVTIAGRETYVQLADLPVGIMWLLAMSGLGLYGVMLAGWSSGSKYPLLGSVRASAQLLSYEAAFSLAIVGVLVQANTLSTRAIVNKQGWDGVASIFNGDWYWLPAIVAFMVFLVSAVAETNHPPFDLVEAEQELTGGFFTEYTGIRFAIFYLAEFMNLITMSAIAVTLFLGGPSGPALGFLDANGWFNAWVMPIFWFMLKVILLLFCTVWVRATLPRLRYDQLMALGWKFLIEISFLWVMVSGVVVVAKDQGWEMWIVLPAAIAGALLVGGALYLSVPKKSEPKRRATASRVSRLAASATSRQEIK